MSFLVGTSVVGTTDNVPEGGFFLNLDPGWDM